MGGRSLRPARQGTFDGLCGVYAVINAVDLVEPRTRRSAFHSDLFIQLTHGLGAAALLRSMDTGVDGTELLRATRAAFAWLAITYGVDLEIGRPFVRRRFASTRAYVRALSQLVDPPRSAAVVSFMRPGRSHWSAVKTVDGGVLHLRDSVGLGRLDTAAFSVAGDEVRLRTADTLAIATSEAGC